MTTHSEDLVSLDELRSVLSTYAGPDEPRERPSRRRARRLRPVLVAAVATAALVGAGVAIAAGLGAFNGISAAQNTPTGADVLPPALLAQIEQMNPQDPSAPQLLPDTARVLGTMPDGSKVYGLTDTRGDLCLIGAVGSCGPPLSDKQPITFSAANDAPTTGATFIAEGVAIDGVASVSFTPVPGDGAEVTVPVKNNVWVYKEPDSHAVNGHCIVAHLGDGSSVEPFPEVPCP
jgi:hypothetical protein